MIKLQILNEKLTHNYDDLSENRNGLTKIINEKMSLSTLNQELFLRIV